MHHLLILVCFLAMTPNPASGASIAFEQDGWTLGGPLRVLFTGEDSDGDGALVTAELVEFDASWRTPDGRTTSWMLPHIEPDGFFFQDLDDYVFFVRNPEYSMVNTVLDGEAIASVFDQFLFPVDATVTPAAAVPEPATLWLLGAGALGLAAGRARRDRCDE